MKIDSSREISRTVDVEIYIQTIICYSVKDGKIHVENQSEGYDIASEEFTVEAFLQEIGIPRAALEQALARGYEFHPSGPLKGAPWRKPQAEAKA